MKPLLSVTKYAYVKLSYFFRYHLGFFVIIIIIIGKTILFEPLAFLRRFCQISYRFHFF
jgi:hypothetical protein